MDKNSENALSERNWYKDDNQSHNYGEEAFRVLRIQSEIVDGLEKLRRFDRVVSILGSARADKNSPQAQAAFALSKRFSEDGIAIMTGGGPGIMEAANQAAFPSELSIGLTIDLADGEEANSYLNELIDFRYFFVRKLMFVKKSSAFVYFPGGFGTLDELFTIATLMQTQKTTKAPFILFDRDFWLPLMDWVKEKLTKNHYIEEDEWNFIKLVDTVEEAYDQIMLNFSKRN